MDVTPLLWKRKTQFLYFIGFCLPICFVLLFSVQRIFYMKDILTWTDDPTTRTKERNQTLSPNITPSTLLWKAAGKHAAGAAKHNRDMTTGFIAEPEFHISPWLNTQMQAKDSILHFHTDKGHVRTVPKNTNQLMSSVCALSPPKAPTYTYLHHNTLLPTMQAPRHAHIICTLPLATSKTCLHVHILHKCQLLPNTEQQDMRTLYWDSSMCPEHFRYMYSFVADNGMQMYTQSWTHTK